MRHIRHTRQGGMALVEALVASALLALGLLGATRLTTHALHAALQTRQDVQAQVLALEALDCAVARQSPCPAAAQRQQQGTTFRLEMTRTPLDAALETLQVQVQWADTSGQNQSIRLQTRVSAMPDGLGLSSP